MTVFRHPNFFSLQVNFLPLDEIFHSNFHHFSPASMMIAIPISSAGAQPLPMLGSAPLIVQIHLQIQFALALLRPPAESPAWLSFKPTERQNESRLRVN
jgi:hypothetical protein